MLITRIVTAIALFAVLALVLSTGEALYFNLLLTAFSVVTLWEWLRLTVANQKLSKNYYYGLGVVTILFVAFSFLLKPGGNFYFYHLLLISFSLICSLVWLFVIPFILIRAQTNHIKYAIFHQVFAVLTILVTALTLMLFNAQYGIWFILSFLILIWLADTFAYFGGRYFQGAKLAPKLSPGKTRSGALCGILSAVIWLIITAYFTKGSFSAELLNQTNFLILLAVAVILPIYSIVGDLYESVMKRRANVKDSSHLLPGHGGFWDRLDSILAVTPLAHTVLFLLG